MQIRFFAGAAETAGTDQLVFDAASCSAQEVIDVLVADNPKLERVFQVSSLLADGIRLQTLDQDISGVQQLDVLPPFAGG